MNPLTARAPARSGAWGRRRSLKRLELTWLILLAGCPSEDSLSSVSPIAVLRPPPNTTLIFEEVVLEKNVAAPIAVLVRNEGEVPLTVSARIDGGGPIRVSSVNKRIQAGAKGEIFLRFEPVVHGDFTATLIVETNDPKLRVAEYPVRGSARERCRFYAWPPHQQFQLDETRSVMIYNTSLSSCEITRLFTDEELFDLVDAPALPYTLEASSELEIRVKHLKRTDEGGRPVRELHIKDSDATEITVSFEGALPIWNCLGVFPPELEFPDTDLGVRGRGRAIVYSSCEEPAEVRSAHVGRGYYFFEVDQSQFPLIVPPLGEVEVFIDYLPFEESGDQGRLTINTNDAAHRQLRIELEGKAVLPELLTVPVIDFGTAVPGCAPRTERVPLLAVGKARTIVTGLHIDGDPSFTLTGVVVDGLPLSDPTPPFTIPSGSSGYAIVDFGPTGVSPPDRAAALVIQHNELDRTRKVELRGDVASATPVTESFTAPPGASVDVLMVIDDSASMVEEQERLRAGLGAFLSMTEAMGADYQIAVTSPDEEGDLAGFPNICPPHPAVLDRSYVDLGTRQAAMRCSTEVGIRSRVPQAALGAAVAALRRSFDPMSVPNPLPSFLRPGAELAVVVLTDEEDQSRASNNALRDYFHSAKGTYRPDRVAIHAIAGDPTFECATDPWIVGSRRYPQITRETGGTFHDACSQDYAPYLDALATAIFSARVRFDLSRLADETTIQVFVDGVPVPEDILDGYTYDRGTRAIQLHGVSQPAPGSEITISYAPECS